MITKYEEDNLANCLDSVKDIINEMEKIAMELNPKYKEKIMLE